MDDDGLRLCVSIGTYGVCSSHCQVDCFLYYSQLWCDSKLVFGACLVCGLPNLVDHSMHLHFLEARLYQIYCKC